MIPYDQEHAHVLVQVFRVGSMMYPVMRRRHKDIFKPAHFMYQFGMHKYSPDLRGGINKNDIERVET